MMELLLRLIASLAVVIGLLLVLARLGAKRFSGSPDSLVRVIHRQPLSRTSSLAVVDVAGRILVLGATENQISLVTELDAVDLEQASARALLPSPRAALDDAESAEHPAEAAEAALAAGGSAPTAIRAARATTAARRADRSARVSPLSGSVLSPATWQAARAAVTGRNPAGRRRAGGSRRAS